MICGFLEIVKTVEPCDEKVCGDGFVEAFDDCDDGDHRGNADNDSHQRKGGPQFVCAETWSRYEEGFPE